MNKMVNIAVSASLSTNFYLEVPENATEEQIKELARKEVIPPNQYPKVVDDFLSKMGINIKGIDSMLKDWDLDEIEFIIENDK